MATETLWFYKEWGIPSSVAKRQKLSIIPSNDMKRSLYKVEMLLESTPNLDLAKLKKLLHSNSFISSKVIMLSHK